jgi:hypothetical protein
MYQRSPWNLSGFLALAFCLIACGSQKRRDGPADLAELQRVQSAVHEMSIVVTVGANQAEFSRRLTDVLLKIGDIQQSEQQVSAKFPSNERQTVEQTYRHFIHALDAYSQSKDFFGDVHKEQLDPFDGDYLFGQKRYDALREAFPGLQGLDAAVNYSEDLGGTKYWRGDMLHALWMYAGNEEQQAKTLIGQLEIVTRYE